MDGPVIAESVVTAQPVVIDEAPVVVEMPTSTEPTVRMSILGEVAPTEAELRGEVRPDESREKEAAAPEPKEESAEKETKQPETEAKKETPEKPAEKADEKTVPLAALHEERKARKALAKKVEQLEALLNQGPQVKAPAAVEKPKEQEYAPIPEHLEVEVREFIESYPEFADLVMESSQEGNRVRSRLEKAGVDAAANMAQVLQRQRTEAKEQEHREAAKFSHMIETAYQQMESVVPGLFDADGSPSELNGKLTEFAESTLGYSREQLAAMTNPRTIVLPPGAKSPIYLGQKAAENLKVVWNAYQKLNAADPKNIEAGLRERVEKEMSEKVLKKLKTAAGGTGLHEMSIAAGSQPNTPFSDQDFEKAYRKMNSEQREMYLRTGTISGV